MREVGDYVDHDAAQSSDRDRVRSSYLDRRKPRPIGRDEPRCRADSRSRKLSRAFLPFRRDARVDPEIVTCTRVDPREAAPRGDKQEVARRVLVVPPAGRDRLGDLRMEYDRVIRARLQGTQARPPFGMGARWRGSGALVPHAEAALKLAAARNANQSRDRRAGLRFTSH